MCSLNAARLRFGAKSWSSCDLIWYNLVLRLTSVCVLVFFKSFLLCCCLLVRRASFAFSFLVKDSSFISNIFSIDRINRIVAGWLMQIQRTQQERQQVALSAWLKCFYSYFWTSRTNKQMKKIATFPDQDHFFNLVSSVFTRLASASQHTCIFGNWVFVFEVKHGCCYYCFYYYCYRTCCYLERLVFERRRLLHCAQLISVYPTIEIGRLKCLFAKQSVEFEAAKEDLPCVFSMYL